MRNMKEDACDEILDEFEQKGLKDKYLTFMVCREMYGIDIKYVTEILSMEAITSMPEMPPYIKGIINLRGRIIPVMDVRLRFGKQDKPYDDRTCIIVINYGEKLSGLIVDSVSDVLTIPAENIEVLPSVGNVNANGFIENIGKLNGQVILLICCCRLINALPESI